MQRSITLSAFPGIIPLMTSLVNRKPDFNAHRLLLQTSLTSLDSPSFSSGIEDNGQYSVRSTSSMVVGRQEPARKYDLPTIAVYSCPMRSDISSTARILTDTGGR